MNDSELNDLLDTAKLNITSERVRRVRTAVIVAAHAIQRPSPWALVFGFRPAVLLATGLLGLFLGASLPAVTLESGSNAAFLDYHPQSFLTGDYG